MYISAFCYQYLLPSSVKITVKLCPVSMIIWFSYVRYQNASKHTCSNFVISTMHAFSGGKVSWFSS